MKLRPTLHSSLNRASASAHNVTKIGKVASAPRSIVHRCPVIASVGFGPSGLFSFKDMLEKITVGNRDVHFQIFEPSERLGRGAAWSVGTNEDFWANMIVQTIQICPDARRIARELGLTAEQNYVRRHLIGEFLERYWEAIQQKAARMGVRVDVFHEHVLDITPHDGKYHLSTSNREVTVDSVVLALGQFPPNQYEEFHDEENFIADPWSWRPNGSEGNTLILGCGLTSIDKTIELHAAGHKSTIVWAAHRASVPWPRPRAETISLSLNESMLRDMAAANDGTISMDTVKSLFFAEISRLGIPFADFQTTYDLSRSHPVTALSEGLARARKVERYFGVLKQVDYLLPVFWDLMDDDGRKWMKKHYSEYARYSFAIPEVTAVRMLRWIESGGIRLVSGKDWELRKGRDGEFQLRKDCDGIIEVSRFDTVINATGFGQDILKSKSTLVKNLRRRGLLVPHPDGGAKCDFHSGQLFDKFDKPIHGIYTLNGTLNSGVRLFTNEMYELAKQAQRTATAVSSSIEDESVYSRSLSWVEGQ